MHVAGTRIINFTAQIHDALNMQRNQRTTFGILGEWHLSTPLNPPMLKNGR